MRILLFLTVILLAIPGCDTDTRVREPGDRLRVIATTSIIADLVRQIGGEHVEVTGLMGPGVDPHLYQASAGDVTRMARADLILYNGLHLEGKMADVFSQMNRRNIRTVAVAEEAIPRDRLLESSEFVGNYDPHVWFDVSLWQRVATRIRDVLVEMDPVHEVVFSERLDAYLAEMDELEAYVRRRVAEMPENLRVIVTSHDAFGYFGRAYGFEVRGLQGISTVTEAGTADVQELAAFVAERRIPALFIESSVSPRGIEAVREAVRARGFDVSIGGTLFGDALGSPGTPAGTYVGMIRHNIDTIVTSLMRDASMASDVDAGVASASNVDAGVASAIGATTIPGGRASSRG